MIIDPENDLTEDTDLQFRGIMLTDGLLKQYFCDNDMVYPKIESGAIKSVIFIYSFIVDRVFWTPVKAHLREIPEEKHLRQIPMWADDDFWRFCDIMFVEMGLDL